MNQVREDDYEATEMSNATAFNVSTDSVNQIVFYTPDEFLLSPDDEKTVAHYFMVAIVINFLVILTAALLWTCIKEITKEQRRNGRTDNSWVEK